jgi:hypothetical protein
VHGPKLIGIHKRIVPEQYDEFAIPKDQPHTSGQLFHVVVARARVGEVQRAQVREGRQSLDHADAHLRGQHAQGVEPLEGAEGFDPPLVTSVYCTNRLTEGATGRLMWTTAGEGHPSNGGGSRD